MRTELCKVTKFNTLHLQQKLSMTMNIQSSPNWMSAEIQAQSEPPPIPLTKEHEEEEFVSHVLKVKMWRNPAWTTSKTYMLKTAVFENGQLEELLEFLKTSRSQ